MKKRMSDIDMLCGFMLGVVIVAFIWSLCETVNAEKVATQLCEYLDSGLLDYEVEDNKFKRIKCGEEQPFIEGLEAEKLIEIMG